jgi:hypothetical protein
MLISFHEEPLCIIKLDASSCKAGKIQVTVQDLYFVGRVKFWMRIRRSSSIISLKN